MLIISKRRLPVTVLMLIAVFAGLTVPCRAGEPLRLSVWPDEAPLGDGKSEKAEVPITVHLPEPGSAKGAAMVICPGGGYGGRVVEGEGHGIARWLNSHGIAGVVLEYRLPGGNYHRPMLDAQRAIRVVRSHAAEWKLDPRRIGIIGFSAGGHLASTAGTHFDAGNEKSTDPVERLSCRPDFMVLVYPVITMGETTHGGSRKNLLGPSPSAELMEFLSSEKQVSDKTPPTFLTHARTDAVVPVAHSRMFYDALKAHGVPAEMQEFPNGLMVTTDTRARNGMPGRNALSNGWASAGCWDHPIEPVGPVSPSSPVCHCSAPPPTGPPVQNSKIQIPYTGWNSFPEFSRGGIDSDWSYYNPTFAAAFARKIEASRM